MTKEREHLEHLLQNGPVEIRAIDKTSEKARKENRPVIWSGVYSRYDCLRAAVAQGEKMGADVYSTINPTGKSVTNNALMPFVKTSQDDDIKKIRTIFFDFDPVREKGAASTDEQAQQSLDLAMSLTDFLDNEKWGAPTIGLSGNGAHLLYRTEINTGEGAVIAKLYALLKKRFTTDEVDFDVSVKNSSRIARVLGSMNQKAQRRSKCILCPDDETPSSVIFDTVKRYTPKEKKKTWVKPANDDGPRVDGATVFDAFHKAGLILAEPDSGKFWVKCPNIGQHSETGPTDSVLWFDGRFANYHCSHSHCSNLKLSNVMGMLSC